MVTSHRTRLLVCLFALLGIDARAESLETDLLIVGGNESACSAAVQAARLGVKRIVLVNDIDWLGGQFSAEGVGCLDEWTTVEGKRTNFPRSGLFLEFVNRIRAHNVAKYGVASPGNAYCGTETIEPAAAAKLFEELLAPYSEKGTRQLRVERGWQPASVELDGNRVASVVFEKVTAPKERLIVRAKLTLDSSDWGDVIRLSGAKYGAGPDLRSRFGEPSAPESFDDAGRQEMNPLSWCLVLREAGREVTFPKPASYDARSFAALDKTPPWVNSDMSAGIYSQSGWSVYTHRRLVDRWHHKLPVGSETTFLNWPVQDYPLCQLPQRVVDVLEATEAGASKKNIVEMTPA
ncbi:MAG: FAD-dependent oxidoreductase, partial [Planctomycetaceae bacterium]|nr:FAD-dependent oxidoreductase [Planctomycetaceae bacterium]